MNPATMNRGEQLIRSGDMVGFRSFLFDEFKLVPHRQIAAHVSKLVAFNQHDRAVRLFRKALADHSNGAAVAGLTTRIAIKVALLVGSLAGLVWAIKTIWE